MTIVKSLSQRTPTVTAPELITDLVPPPQFGEATFGNHVPDPAQPSQAFAAKSARDFVSAAEPDGKAFGKIKILRKKAAAPRARAGIYLDGGFGVGKTHLLAASWHLASGRKAFGTFMEYTNIVGAIGFHNTVQALKDHFLVAVDEFELDDPGDTVLMSRLMRELADSGVKLMATSNTLPDALGEGRFAAADFKREIQSLADRFLVVRIEGQDYRHRGLETPPEPLAPGEVEKMLRDNQDRNISVDDFAELLAHLAAIHPSRYRQLLDGVDTVVWEDMATIRDQGTALRFVVLVDRLYDAAVAVCGTGEHYLRLFDAQILEGGYRKKYYRALSRVAALARMGQGLVKAGPTDHDGKENK